MTTKDICFKAEPSIEEMRFLVEQYVKEKKGRDVSINLEKYVSASDGMIGRMSYGNQLDLLVTAYNSASKYFCKKHEGENQDVY